MRAGITQAQINESRQSREKFILKEVSEYFENGGDISATDKVGANIVSFLFDLAFLFYVIQRLYHIFQKVSHYKQ